MNYKKILYSLLVLLVPVSSFSAPLIGVSSYWQCTTEDKTNKQWSAQNPYQKIALTLAFDACKKESKDPKTCKGSSSKCEGFYLGLSNKPLWQCTALDLTGSPWQSNFYPNSEDAALAAKDYCKDKSSIPDTCYINLVTCRNMNAGAQM